MRALFRRSQRFLLWLGILPLALAFVSYRTSSEHIASVEATLATDHFIRQLDQLMSTLQAAETGQRGFLLTGQYQYLSPYLAAEAAVADDLAQTEELALRNGVPKQQIGQLHRLVNGKMEELQTTIHLRRTKGEAASLQEVKTNQGQKQMSEIRSLIGRWEDGQAATFQIRWQKQHRNEDRLRAVLATGVLGGLLLLVLSYRFNVAYELERDQVEAQIRKLNDTLELRVKDRTAELEARTQELELRRAELQRSNLDLAQFAYVASHDLQEPLRMVASYVGLLARRYRGQLDETADRYIQFAVDGTHRMQTLIQDVLLYSCASTQALEKEFVPLERVVRNGLEKLTAENETSGAVIRYTNLPVVPGDEAKLTQVMRSLISNALKFAKPSIRAEIEINAQLSGAMWLISVADNGIGFEPKYAERIFEIFQRLHSIGRYSGNGIGLALARRIVEHHGGKLWAESEPEVGSTFFFTLPTEEHPPNGLAQWRKEQEVVLQQTLHNVDQ